MSVYVCVLARRRCVLCCCLACFLRAFSPSDVGYGPWPGAMPCAVTGIMSFLFLLVSSCLSSRSPFRASACPALHCTLLISASKRRASVRAEHSLGPTTSLSASFHPIAAVFFIFVHIRSTPFSPSFVHTTMPVPTLASDPRPCTPCHAMRSPLLLDSASDPDTRLSSSV